MPPLTGPNHDTLGTPGLPPRQATERASDSYRAAESYPSESPSPGLPFPGPLLSRLSTKGRLLSTSATKGPFQRPSWKICLASASSWKVCLATSPYVDSPLSNVPLGGQPALQRPPRWTSLLSNCQHPPPVQADTATDNGKGAERTCRPAPSEPGLEVYGGVRLTGGSRGRRR